MATCFPIYLASIYWAADSSLKWDYPNQYICLDTAVSIAFWSTQRWENIRTCFQFVPILKKRDQWSIHWIYWNQIHKTKYWNPKYFLSFKWKFDDFFIQFDRGDKKTEGEKKFSLLKCIQKSNVIKENIWVLVFSFSGCNGLITYHYN